MGMDFVALLKYHSPDARLADVLTALARESPAELKHVRRLMDAKDFAAAVHPRATWARWDRAALDATWSPVLPDLSVSLWTPEDFSLCFGADTVCIYHLLRWYYFLTDAELREAMLSACAALGRLLGATDCIVTSDFNPAAQAFFKAATFEGALQTAEPENGEVANCEDLYLTFRMEWDQEIDTWDSYGYWRFRWEPAMAADHPWPPVPKRRAAPPVAEGSCRAVDAEVLEGLRHDLRYETRRKQEKAADALCELGLAATAAVPDLVEALDKRWPTVRRRVAHALGRMGGASDIPALQRVLEHDADAEVRQAAADALIRLGAGLSVLHSADDDRRRRAADGLAALDPAARAAVPSLLAMLLADDRIISRETRRALARAIWLIGPDADLLRELQKALRMPDELVRLWIARAFAVLGPAAASATRVLVQALDDPAEMVRSSLAWVLARIGPAAIGPVVGALREGPPTLRRGAAECLGRMRAGDAASALQDAAHDPDELVRQAATESLRQLAAVERA